MSRGSDLVGGHWLSIAGPPCFDEVAHAFFQGREPCRERDADVGPVGFEGAELLARRDEHTVASGSPDDCSVMTPQRDESLVERCTCELDLMAGAIDHGMSGTDAAGENPTHLIPTVVVPA